MVLQAGLHATTVLMGITTLARLNLPNKGHLHALIRGQSLLISVLSRHNSNHNPRTRGLNHHIAHPHAVLLHPAAVVVVIAVVAAQVVADGKFDNIISTGWPALAGHPLFTAFFNIGVAIRFRYLL